VNPVTVSITVGRPREEVFEYLADIANHAEFTDHFLVDWHLTRIDSYGEGAGARFRVKAPGNRFSWADATLAEVKPPWRIVEVGRTGKFNRVRTLGSYTLSPVGPGATRVEYTLETEPATISDRIGESLGARFWFKRKLSRAMRRLRAILEEDRERGTRPTVAAGEGRYPAVGGPRHLPGTGFGGGTPTPNATQ
jgi:uncharacterized protein YndB with AHSA1/START domain